MKGYCDYQTFMANGGNKSGCANLFYPSDRIHKAGLKIILDSNKKQLKRTVSSIEREELKKEIEILESLLKNDNIWA